MTADTPPKLTPERIDLSVGGSWQEDWEEKLPALARERQAIDAMRRAVMVVAGPAAEVGALAPEHRSLRLDGLAKAGKSAIAGISRVEKESSERLDRLFADFHAESRRQLASLKGDIHSALSAAQIRTNIARQEHPGSFAHSLLEDLEVVRAVLAAPAAASGLKQQDHLLLWASAESRHFPEIHRGREVVKKAQDELTRSAKVARQMVGELSGLRETSRGWVAAWEET